MSSTKPSRYVIRVISVILFLAGCAAPPTTISPTAVPTTTIVTPPSEHPTLAPPTPSTTPPPERRGVILDVDMSGDDIMAILYLIMSPDVDVKAITVVQGVAAVEDGTKNALRLLTLIGRTDIPVIKGAATPLEGNHSFPKEWMGSAKAAYGLALPKSSANVSPLSASEMIRDLVNQSPGKISLIALGPLTNVAQALRDDSDLAARLQQIVVGDGAIFVPGNINAEYSTIPNKVSGWNLWVDPRAADIVFRSGAPLTVVPLDVTSPAGPHPLLLTRRYVEKFHQVAAGSSGKALDTLTANWMKYYDPSQAAVPLWDVVTAMLFENPAVCTDWREMSIEIGVGSDETAGQTRVVQGSQPNARVCLGGDQTGFETLMLSTAK